MHIDTNMFTLVWRYSHTIEVDAFEVQQKINSGSWETIMDNYQDTTLLIVVNNPEDNHSYRVRAKVNDYWYPSTWSNVVQLDILTGNNELSFTDDDVTVYPNPFSGYLKVGTDMKSSGNQTIKIYDLTGKEILKTENSNGIVEISTTEWEKGIYFIKIIYNDKEIIRKVIKQ